jgi:hypothetical protein
MNPKKLESARILRKKVRSKERKERRAAVLIAERGDKAGSLWYWLCDFHISTDDIVDSDPLTEYEADPDLVYADADLEMGVLPLE